MAVPTGTASLLDIQNEFGGDTPISLSEYYGVVDGVPSSGTISIDDFRGKSQATAFTFTISSNKVNANLRTLAINAGWDQSVPVEATISGSVVISGDMQGNYTPALAVDGPWPNGVTLINNGIIVGHGGNGGVGVSITGSGTVAGTAGSAGGRALGVAVPLTLQNNGIIAAGGGGGGGGSASFAYGYGSCGGGGGGGGRSGNYNSFGAPGGYAYGDVYGYNAAGRAGGNGGYVQQGSGGAGGLVYVGFYNYGGTGGSGGSWGTSGNSGNYGSFAAGYATSGGASGQAIYGNSYITYTATGTRLGSIV